MNPLTEICVIALQVVRASLRFHFRKWIGSCHPSPFRADCSTALELLVSAPWSPDELRADLSGWVTRIPFFIDLSSTAYCTVLYCAVVLLLGVHTQTGLIIFKMSFSVDYTRAQSTYFFKSSALTTPSPVISNLLKAFSTIFKASFVKGSYKQTTRGCIVKG